MDRAKSRAWTMVTGHIWNVFEHELGNIQESVEWENAYIALLA